MGHFQVPYTASVATFFSFTLLVLFGYFRDLIYRWTGQDTKARPQEGYSPLLADWEDFFARRIFVRARDCFDRPIDSCPGAKINVLLRDSKSLSEPLKLTGKSKECLNLGSYNYLGFGDPNSPTKPKVFESLNKFSASQCTNRYSLGTTSEHRECEELVARYVGKEAAMIFAMGFGTNSTSIPSLVGKGDLIVSDENNHSSIIVGARSSGAKIKVFKHNNPDDLEAVIRRSIVDGQPKSHRPWRKILIMVEGIYSMEGEMCPLPEFVRVKKKYGCYLYVDEAHSIGAIGPNGRGICDYKKVDPADVDILMGTFTKSFGAVGGYIAASKKLIDYIRRRCAGHAYSGCISPPACRQIIEAMKIIMGEDGTNIGEKRLITLKNNSNFFRKGLMEAGLHVMGDWDSPVIPTLLCHPAKGVHLSRECLKRGIAIVVVSFPATPLLLGRARFCISAAHSMEDLKAALECIRDLTGHTGLNFHERKAVNGPEPLSQPK